MLESTHSFAAYQAELKKNGTGNKSKREGKLAPVLSEAEEDGIVDTEKNSVSNSEDDSQEEVAI